MPAIGWCVGFRLLCTKRWNCGGNVSAWAGRMDALIIANGLSGGPCLFESIPPMPARI